MASPHFERAWYSRRRPHLRHVALTPPRMAPLPSALIDCVVPSLPTPRELAIWLDLSPDELGWLTGPLARPLRDGEFPAHYNTRWLAKRSGGLRLLEIPKTQLRVVQRRLLHGLLEYVPPHEAAHGFRGRHSCITNAKPHVGKPVVMRLDLEDFFVSIGAGKVFEVFSTLGYPSATARALTRLTTCATAKTAWSAEALREFENGSHTIDWLTQKRLAAAHLPQGAPTSPALANLCAFQFDMRVQALAEKFGVQYTRYADDLTFSGDENLARRSRTFAAHIGAIALDQRFRINHRKTRVMRAATRQQVTGIIVNRTPNVPREHYDRIKAMLHNSLRDGLDTNHPFETLLFKHQLAGHIAHISAIHPGRGERLRHRFERVRWPDESRAR